MLDQLKPARGAIKKSRRVGRGIGSGSGKTCGRGTKGQGSRSGGGVKAGFEGGQMPLQRRLPKRGFTNPFRTEYSVVNLKDLSRITDVDVVDPDLMVCFRLARKGMPIKILAVGELDRPVTIRAHRFSVSAADKVVRAGGKTEII
ncbi:MAG TPA: 50S ribosomal protein L15 [Proteobacteria bacterium]|nr:50S ribosomal protein L15 [Pseudomonadota bacterium]